MKRLLIVVDYQNNFVNGPLGFPQARKIEQALCQKIAWYHKGGYDVLFTKDTFFENATFSKKRPSTPCTENFEWQFCKAVEQLRRPTDQILCKHSFGSVDLIELLRKKQYDAVELCGVLSHICVLVNAVLCQTALPEARIIIDAECVASNDEKLHQEALDILEGLQMQVDHRRQDPIKNEIF